MASLPLLILYSYPNYISSWNLTWVECIFYLSVLQELHDYALRSPHLQTPYLHCISLGSLPGSSAYTVTHLEGRTHLLFTLHHPSTLHFPTGGTQQTLRWKVVERVDMLNSTRSKPEPCVMLLKLSFQADSESLGSYQRVFCHLAHTSSSCWQSYHHTPSQAHTRVMYMCESNYPFKADTSVWDNLFLEKPCLKEARFKLQFERRAHRTLAAVCKGTASEGIRNLFSKSSKESSILHVQNSK